MLNERVGMQDNIILALITNILNSFRNYRNDFLLIIMYYVLHRLKIFLFYKSSLNRTAKKISIELYHKTSLDSHCLELTSHYF